MFDIITFGSATKDIFVRPKKLSVLKYSKPFDSAQGREAQQVCFPFGSKIDVDSIEFHSGGGGANSSATFALQGFATAFCGIVGSDSAGQEVLAELKKLKIDIGLAEAKKEKLTNHSVIILNEGHDRTILAYRGAAELLTKENIPFKKLKAKWIYAAPLSGKSAHVFGEIVQFAKENNIKVAANPGMAQLALENFAEIAKNIDVLILNQEEASFLTKLSVENEQEIFKKVDDICPGIFVMTKGGQGVTVSDNQQIYYAKPPLDRKIADTTGAGDAFGSGFVAEYIKSGNVETAIHLGMANSVGCLSALGAQNGLLKKGQPFEKVEVSKDIITNAKNHDDE